MKQIFVISCFVFAIAAVIVGISKLVSYGDVSDIHRFAENEGLVVQSIDRKIFSHGPYWVSKDRRIYQVFTRDQREYWFRFGGLFGYDVEQRVNAKYLKIR